MCLFMFIPVESFGRKKWSGRVGSSGGNISPLFFRLVFFLGLWRTFKERLRYVLCFGGGDDVGGREVGYSRGNLLVLSEGK